MEKKLPVWAAAITFFTLSVAINACSGTKNIVTGTATANEITNAIDSSRWQFVAYQVNPQFGRTRQVNGLYSVSWRENKMVVYLPYFGRATAWANVFSSTGPLDFTSADFTPVILKPSAEEWRISIKPKNNREVQTMDFTFFTNGSASLNVIMTNRSAISFSGRVEPLKR